MASQWQDFYSRLKNPFWCESLSIPRSQLRERPGICNLLWLAEQPETPLRENLLALWVLSNASKLDFARSSLEHYAATHSLQEFVEVRTPYLKILELQKIAKGKQNDARRSPC